jgi:hypothetical protein
MKILNDEAFPKEEIPLTDQISVSSRSLICEYLCESHRKEFHPKNYSKFNHSAKI